MVNDYKTGKMVGKFQIDADLYKSIAQQPEGVCAARSLLDSDQIAKIQEKHSDFAADSTIFCD